MFHRVNMLAAETSLGKTSFLISGNLQLPVVLCAYPKSAFPVLLSTILLCSVL